MKRRFKKKHQSSDTSSGSSSYSAEKKEEVIEDRNESFGDPTSQKQTEAESKDETSDKFISYDAKIPDEFMGMDLQRAFYSSVPIYNGSMMPSTKPDYDDMKPRSQSLPYSAEFYESETQGLLDELRSLSPGQTKPASEQEDEADPVRHDGMVLPGPYAGLPSSEYFRQQLNRQVKPGSMNISQKNSTMPLYDQRAKFERFEIPDPAFPIGLLSSCSLPKDQGPTPSPLTDHFHSWRCSPAFSPRALKTKPEEREKMAGIYSRAEGAHVSSLTKDFPEKLQFTQGTSSTFKHHPHTTVYGSNPNQASLPLKSNISKAVTTRGRSRSLPSPPSSSSSIQASVADLQVLERINQRAKKLELLLQTLERNIASLTERRGQQKREEANCPSRIGYGRYLNAYQGPELPDDLSLRSTRHLKPDDTNMEQKRSAVYPFYTITPQHQPVIFGNVRAPAVATHSGLPSDCSLQQHQSQTPSSFIDPYYSWEYSPFYSPCALKTKPERKRMVAEIYKRAQPASVSQLTEDFPEKKKFTQGTSSTFRWHPNTKVDVSNPKQPALAPKSNISKAATKRVRSRSLSSPSSSSSSVHPSVDGPQFPESDQEILNVIEPFLQQRNRKLPSHQKLRGQEKGEEAICPSILDYRRYLTSYQDPELPETLSPQSTRHMKPDDTNMEQKRSALVQHQHPQFPAPTPEHINTETQEEAASGSGSLSVSEGTEPVLYEDPGPDLDVEADPLILAELLSDTKALLSSSDVQFCSTDSCWTRRTSSSVPGSVSMPSLNHITSAGNNKPTRAASLPDLKLQSSFEEFTPDVSEDHEDHEGYRFQCSCPGLYQCSVTGLVFDMEGEGDVLYRTVPWNRRLLVQHHKKPGGPLFDIKCQQQSVRQLHLPHCQILPTAGFLEVAHVKDDGVEFITPQKITETHLVINIRGFSGFGNVKDEDSPPDPIRALVLLFYRPPDDSDVTSELSVLLLPRNIVIRDLQRTRRKLVGDERYINVSPHCKLLPDQVYTLSTAPEDDLIKVQPTEAEFDEDSYDNYFPSIVVSLKTLIRDISLSLKDKTTSCCVWERDVCLLPSRAKPLTLPPKEKLLNVRSSFIRRTSGPVLNSLLDKLLEKKVFDDSEREEAHEMPNRRDKARFIIDTVRKKGDAASSEMIKFFCELDPYLSRDLELNSVQKDEMEQG